jgi:tripartite-type tricarboxylate transporter receptor subunit TctC
MKRLISLALAASACLGAARAQTPDAATFYRNRQILLQVGSAPGDGYDAYARLIARFVAKYIPGEPRVVVQNVPGGGSLVLANQFGNVTPRDGSVFGIFNGGMPTTPLLTPSAAKFDPRKFAFVGSPNREVQVFLAWGASPAKSMADLFDREIIVGASAPGAATCDFPIVTNALIGTKFRVIAGYAGTAALNLAMERGEVHANPAVAWVSVKTQYAKPIAEGKLRVVGQFGFRAHRELASTPLFPTGKTEADRQIFQLLYARQDYGRPLLLPPGVPSDRVAALRAAMAATFADPAFRAEAARLDLDVDPVTGEEMQELTDRLFATPPETLRRLQSILAGP